MLTSSDARVCKTNGGHSPTHSGSKTGNWMTQALTVALSLALIPAVMVVFAGNAVGVVETVSVTVSRGAGRVRPPCGALAG